MSRFTLNGRAGRGRGRAADAADRFAAPRARRDRHACRLRARRLRRLHGQIDGAPARACLTLAVQAEGCGHPHRRGARAGAGAALARCRRRSGAITPCNAASARAGILMSLDALSAPLRRTPTRTEIREVLGGHLCRCTGYAPIIDAALEARGDAGGEEDVRCLTSAPSFARQRRARPECARHRRWRRAAHLCGVVPRASPRWSRASTRSGLRRGDHLLTVLQNRWEAATLHWACQFAGIVITPLNWRAKPDEIDYCVDERRGARDRLRGGLGRGRRG